ncbi:RNA-binding cell elongation regulator Jag/EloR [Thermoactinomyces sp. CICC 10521]|uniref:RNA-binding cell elongation regulator Jag/EloR n=1 Tax=Thermoactinomyces sp. CICC 10521 TaxID=2767426 RepID=UPI0018DCF612|nr:RNA-binding cell elongation regulator Jag/EloR [Thermoactinomyces sp. CICC 10521]MBH8607740.1 protein jag [Thermoactinomyces sp. CICC 10521]
MNKLIVEAGTVEEAVAQALKQLGVSRERFRVRVVEEASRGFLGLFGRRPAKVEVEVMEDPAEKARAFLQGLLQRMGADATVEITTSAKKGFVTITAREEQTGALIGRHGQTLEAMELLVNLAANRREEKPARFELDIDGYRERRRKALAEYVMKMAAKARQTRQEVRLSPMPANERKWVHQTIKKEPNLKTVSRGEEPNRSVVIYWQD